MARDRARVFLARLLSAYGMIFILLLVGGFFSLVTIAEQAGGAAGGEALAKSLQPTGDQARQPSLQVFIVAGHGQDDGHFVEALQSTLQRAGISVLGAVKGHPHEVKVALEKLTPNPDSDLVIAASPRAYRWTLLENFGDKFPALMRARLTTQTSHLWPNFLKTDNLRNIANQIAVIAILAIGMTMVIITGGIDLSVGSLIALSAVVATLLIRDLAGGEQASDLGMIGCCLAAIAVCAVIGLASGLLITAFALPAFLVTLCAMLMIGGLAYSVSGSQSVYQVPERFTWLAREAEFLSIPNAVVLMLVLYVIAHVVMTRTVLGRYIYAVGGNAEAARLSGVPVRRILALVYVISGALAGLGGVILASQFRSGSPTYGQMYELYVIAAVVVGGTSLTGGEGRIFGTLIGALLIAVIQNGMNLLGIESNLQRVVLGAIILAAVLLDQLKKRWIR